MAATGHDLMAADTGARVAYLAARRSPRTPQIAGPVAIFSPAIVVPAALSVERAAGAGAETAAGAWVCAGATVVTAALTAVWWSCVARRGHSHL